MYWAISNCCLLFFLAVLAFAAPADLERARELYQQTEYEQVLCLLEASRDKGPATYELIGKAHYGLENFKRASDALERAVAGDPTNSIYVDWLGKAFGRRAVEQAPGAVFELAFDAGCPAAVRSRATAQQGGPGLICGSGDL